MDQVGYIDNEAEQRLKVEFVLDTNNNISPKSEQDREILISAWDIDDEVLEAFLEFVNANLKNNEAKIALLTNTKKYQFFDSEEIYNAAAFKAGLEATREEIEKLIDEIEDSAIFGYENLMLCPKEKL